MTSRRHDRLVRASLAALSAGAGAAHVSVVADHTAVVWWYGAGFGVVAVLQLAWAALLLRREPASRLVLVAGAVGHAAVVCLWVVARTAGLPFVPSDSGTAVGLLDGTAAAFEGLILLGVLYRANSSMRLRPRLQAAVGVVSGVVLLLAAPLTVAALAVGPGHAHGPGSPHPRESGAAHTIDEEPPSQVGVRTRQRREPPRASRTPWNRSALRNIRPRRLPATSAPPGTCSPTTTPMRAPRTPRAQVARGVVPAARPLSPPPLVADLARVRYLVAVHAHLGGEVRETRAEAGVSRLPSVRAKKDETPLGGGASSLLESRMLYLL